MMWSLRSKSFKNLFQKIIQNITIMNNEKKRAKVIDMIDDLYGDSGMAVVNLVTDYMTEEDWGHLYDRLDSDGAFKE